MAKLEIENTMDSNAIGVVVQCRCSAWWKAGWSRFVQSFEPTWTGSWKCHRGIQRLSRYREPYPVRVWASGGSTGIHDWLMSDGTFRTMTCDEAAKLKPND